MTTIPEAFAIAIDLHQKGLLQESAEIYRLILEVDGQNISALNNLGLVSPPEEAVKLFCQVLALNPDYFEARVNLGNALKNLGDYTAAIAAYEQALALRPNHPDALYNLALSLQLQGNLDAVNLLRLTESLNRAGAQAHAVQLYLGWIESHPTDPALYAIYFNLGALLQDMRSLPAAAEAYSKSIAHKPDLAAPYVNLGFVYEMMGDRQKTLTLWQEFLTVCAHITDNAIDDKVMILKQIARLLKSIDHSSVAEDALKQIILLDPQRREIVQHWVDCRMSLCKWPAVGPVGRLSAKAVLQTMAPLTMAFYTDDPFLLLGSAYAYSRHDIGEPSPCLAGSWLPPAQPRERRLRIGYVSSDLFGHAVGYLMTEVFELHDPNLVELFVYSWGPQPDEATALRVKTPVAAWHNVHALSEQQIAALIVADEIDILIDLNGHTSIARTKIFAYRPAPVIVNWLGFAGTMGTPYHHYIIADEIIIPKDYEDYYSEAVVRLPCYQPNDRKRTVAGQSWTRQDAGLPQDAFVYCCFNGTYKISRFTFERWMSILQQVPNSVLWLLNAGAEANANLVQLAKAAGIAEERLVFAPKLPNPSHLARYPLANVFLDTSPYGAHTTASDALWMGVPVLALCGHSFASRVCSSLLRAAGLPELVCDTSAAYVARAVELGQNPTLAHALRDRILANRDHCTLFNMPLLVSSLERLYQDMWQAYADNALPQPRLANAAAYHEIGSELDHESTDTVGDPDYRNRYARLFDYRRPYLPVG